VLTRGPESLDGEDRRSESEDRRAENRFGAGPGAGAAAAERPSTLMDAISRRIVDAIKAEVAVATAQVQEVGDHTARVEAQLAELADAVALGLATPAPAATPVADGRTPERLDAVEERLIRIEALLQNPPAPVLPEPAAPAAVDLSAVEASIAAIESGVRICFEEMAGVARAQADYARINGAAVAESARATTEHVDAIAGAVAAEVAVLRQQIAAVADAVAAHPDPMPLLEAVSEQGAEIQALVMASTADVTRALADLEGREDHAATAEALDALHAAVTAAQVAAERAADRRPIVEEVGVRLAAVQGTLQARLEEVETAVRRTSQSVADQIHSDVASVEARVAAGPDLTPLVGEIGMRLAAGTAAVTARIDEAENTITAATAAVAGRVDLAPIVGEIGVRIAHASGTMQACIAGVASDVTNLQSNLTTGLDEVRAAVVLGQEGNDLRHEALAAHVSAIHAAVDAGVDLAPLTDAVREMATNVVDVQTAVAWANESDDLRHEALAAHVAAIHHAVDRGIDFAPLVAQLERTVRDSACVLTDELSDVRRAVEAGVDLTPVTARLDDVDRALAIIGTTIDDVASGAALTELTIGIEAVRHDVAASAATLASTVSDTAAAVRSGLYEVGALLALRGDMAASASAAHGEMVTHRLGAVEGYLASVADDQGVPARLDAIVASSRLAADGVAALAEWAAGQNGTERIADMQSALERTFTAVTELVPNVEHSLTEAQRSFRQSAQDLVAGLDGVRAHLVASGGFGGVDDRLRELRSHMDTLADEVRGYERSTSPLTIAETLDRGLDATIARLERTVSDIVSRMERRHAELESDSAGIETVLEAIGAGDRLVRERFEVVDDVIGSVRSDLAELRAVRATVDGVKTGLDLLRTVVTETSATGELQRVAGAVADVGRDVRSTVDRVDHLDRGVTALRSDVASTAGVAHATFQAADAVAAAVSAVNRLERQLDVELDDLGRRIDLLTSIVTETHDDSRHDHNGPTRERVASSVSERLSRVREVAAGVSDAVKGERQRLRQRGRSTPPAAAAAPRAIGPAPAASHD